MNNRGNKFLGLSHSKREDLDMDCEDANEVPNDSSLEKFEEHPDGIKYK